MRMAYAKMFSEHPTQLRMLKGREVRKCLPRNGTEKPRSVYMMEGPLCCIKKYLISKALKTEMEYFKDKRVMVLFLPFGELISWRQQFLLVMMAQVKNHGGLHWAAPEHFKSWK